MPTVQQIDADLKTAMLTKNSGAVSVLRMLKTEVKNSEIAQGTVPNEREVEVIIKKEVKKRREAAILYHNGNNIQQAGIEEAEANFLQQYLPEPLSEAVVSEYIKTAIAGLDEVNVSHKGQLIKQTLDHFKGEAEGKMVSTLVSSLLSELDPE